MNIINAIINLVNNPVTELSEVTAGTNRANIAGDALEIYIKDLFAGTFGMPVREKLRIWEQTFSYLGNNSNPPDIMLYDGDAIEVKKIENPKAALALNSSYPKHKLYRTSQFISQACREAEDWTEKDIIYCVGVVKKNTTKLLRLCMVYGLNYCASEECYTRIRELIKIGVESSPGIEFARTKELGHINKIDPLGITYMRVRGMYGIANPWNAFDYVYNDSDRRGHGFDFFCIIDNDKWSTLNGTDDLLDLADRNHNLVIYSAEVKDPDNPARLKGAKLITYECD